MEKREGAMGARGSVVAVEGWAAGAMGAGAATVKGWVVAAMGVAAGARG